jgi:hypothetical protein
MVEMDKQRAQILAEQEKAQEKLVKNENKIGTALY